MQIGSSTSAQNYMAPKAMVVDQFDLTNSADAALHLDRLGEKVMTKEESAGQLKSKFQEFVGQTFFSELIKSMRTSQKGAAYFNGGRAEEIFQGQFDQMMTEHLSESSAKSIADPMFELFQLGRQ